MSLSKNIRFAYNNPEYRTKVFLFYVWRLAFWATNILYLVLWSPILLLFVITAKLIHVYEWGGQTMIHPLWSKGQNILHEVNEAYFDGKD